MQVLLWVSQFQGKWEGESYTYEKTWMWIQLQKLADSRWNEHKKGTVEVILTEVEWNMIKNGNEKYQQWAINEKWNFPDLSARLLDNLPSWKSTDQWYYLYLPVRPRKKYSALNAKIRNDIEILLIWYHRKLQILNLFLQNKPSTKHSILMVQHCFGNGLLQRQNVY
jgi:hypothetical protein